MLRLFTLIRKVSQNRYPILIFGESGTGKELVARSIHEAGPLAGKPFLTIHCGYVAPTLIESELFGCERDALTGATAAKVGLLEAAGGGTLFLEDIGEMPLASQSRFVVALQENEVRPLGSTRRVRMQARIIAASNRDLEADVQRGSFRKDLYFRLNVISLDLPPLRKRRGDIPVLAQYMVEKYQPIRQSHLTISDEAMRLLVNYDWPGNVRELQNCIERAVALGSGPELRASDVTSGLQGHPTIPCAAGEPESRPSRPAETPVSSVGFSAFSPDSPVVPWAEREKQAILGALREAHGDRIQAARLLGIGKTTVYRKLKEYGMSEQAESAAPEERHKSASASGTDE